MIKQIYYRGTNPNSNKRIRTGEESWDNNLFCSLRKDLALNYGPVIEVIAALDCANILTEGTGEFKHIFGEGRNNQSLLDWCVRGKIIAEDLGYDIIEFERQGDVGTIIINEDVIVRNYEEKIGGI